MSDRAKVIIHVGGEDFHPVHAQAARLAEWLEPTCRCHAAESLAAFEHLDECDLLVFLGMYYSGWEGRYRAPGGTHVRQFVRYVTSGKPMIFCHGAIASYDDWPEFGELSGFVWPARRPTFGLPGAYLVRVGRDVRNAEADDAITAGVDDHVLHDAPPINVRIASDMDACIHASIERTSAMSSAVPMWITGQGGRTAGAGKTALIGAGRDMSSFAHPAVQQIWINTVRWCLSTPA